MLLMSMTMNLWNDTMQSWMPCSYSCVYNLIRYPNTLPWQRFFATGWSFFCGQLCVYNPISFRSLSWSKWNNEFIVENISPCLGPQYFAQRISGCFYPHMGWTKSSSNLDTVSSLYKLISKSSICLRGSPRKAMALQFQNLSTWTRGVRGSLQKEAAEASWNTEVASRYYSWHLTSPSSVFTATVCYFSGHRPLVSSEDCRKHSYWFNLYWSYLLHCIIHGYHNLQGKPVYKSTLLDDLATSTESLGKVTPTSWGYAEEYSRKTQSLDL